MSLRIKLILTVTLCVVIPILLITYLTTEFSTHLLQSELEQSALKILTETNSLVQNKIDPIFSYGFLAISNPVLPIATRSQNRKILASVADSIKKGLDLDIVEIIDGTGKIVFSEENPDQVGFSRLESNFVQKALLNYGEKQSLATVGIEKRGNGLAIEIATILPTDSGGKLPAMILMGFYLDDRFFKGIQSIIDGQFILFSQNEIFAATLEQREPLLKMVTHWTQKDWDQMQQGQKVLSNIDWFDTSYVGVFSKMKPDVGHVYLGILLSKEKLIAVQRNARTYILLSGAVGIFLALVLSLIFSGRLVQPLKRLTEVIDRIAKGDSEARVEVTSEDEVGFLASTFNAMMSQLKEAEEKLVRNERLAAIGQLASGVGHELRNPLAAIKNALYFIRSVLKKSPIHEENQPLQSMIHIAESEIDTTVKISNDLLEFSRVLKISPAPVSLNTILDSAFSVIPIPENVEVIKKFDPNLPPFKLDQERMRQVFINLFNNAIEAMPNGGTLYVESSIKEGTVIVIVRDTGTGISEEDQKKIFEPLFTTKTRGTGLGLAIVQRIVEAHSGQIELKSILGQGTEFTLRIPQ